MTLPNLLEEFLEISSPLDVAEYIHDIPVPAEISESLTSPQNLESSIINLPRDVPIEPHTRQELAEWVSRKREGARSGIATTLIVFFGVSLLAEFLLIGLGTFYPQANTALIKDTMPLLINSLTSIVSLALAFYFKER
jgi:hypothetical protein